MVQRPALLWRAELVDQDIDPHLIPYHRAGEAHDPVRFGVPVVKEETGQTG